MSRGDIFSLTVSGLTVIAIIFKTAVFLGITYFTIKYSKPMSRKRFVKKLLFIGFLFCAVGVAENLIINIPVHLLPEYCASEIAKSAVLVILSYFVFCDSDNIDIPLPEKFRKIRPVKAVVEEILPVAKVKYEGNEYRLKKPFHFRTGELINVKIIKDSEICFLD